MSWTTKLLVIANRTVESTEIRDAILNRAAAGPVEVTLVAPASGAGSVRTCRMETARRLDRAVEHLREAGVPVEGVVGDTDPIVAVQDAWDPRRFDEVLVVTLPTGVSRWMTTDLPHRVQRLTAARVTHVVTAAQPVDSAPPSPAPSARRSPDAAVALAGGGSPRRTPSSLVRRPRRSRGGGRAQSILR